MQIQCMPILKVIFVLSTIVSVTDCCSSRILLFRQHTLQIEEHVVQLVNPMELQQQFNVDGLTSATDMFSDTAQMLQLSPHLSFDGELAALATTERDRGPELWSTNEEEEMTTTTKRATTPTPTTLITTTTTLITATNTMATGEPPPDDSSTPRLSIDAANSERNEESVSTTTPAITTTMASTTGKSRSPKLTEDLNFKLPCSDEYIKYFCLNGGNCFRWANANSFSYCVCAVGYVGERCDSKTENGVYVPLRPATPDPQLKTAHIVFSFPMLVLLSTIYVVFGAIFMLRNVSAQRRKQQQLHLHKQRFFVSC
ncbi:protein gurken [Drosophila grimshawi]|uniref:GH13486 n=1 Tax=Drosophila grimshawi TaxID=7222 RepID=B4JPB6_DROGR|nr:protein gurken [Drosophila grimshawi]EDV98746.1 GH13486 [Drosophila grimshawi]